MRKSNNGQRMIMISLDAVGNRDIPYLKTLPNFSRLWKHAARCEHVKSVYPSITYPAHVSIVTGKKPVKHRVINNICLQPEREKPDWLWQRHYVKATTLYDEVLKKGWTVASLLWPVTAKSKVTYNLPEVMANRPWQNQLLVSALNGSPAYELKLNQRFGHLRDGIRQPALDNFVHESAKYTLETYQPDLTMIHFTDVDTNRHIYGVDHEKIKAALDRHDKRLGELLEVIEKTGDMDKTTIVVLGDHCQYDVDRVVYLNYLLKEQGFLKAEGDRIIDYTYVSNNCDGCTYIYENPKKKASKEEYARLCALLEKCKEDEIYGIDHIFTGQEAGALGADDQCVFLIEAKRGIYYLDYCHTLTEPVEKMKKSKMRGVHGYLPTKPDYETFFMATGYGIAKDVEIPTMELYDEGVTLAKVLQVTLDEDIDGKVIEEMLHLD